MVQANANPEKRLFISLITRDIGLTDAIVDLTDNSINATMRALKNPFSSNVDFHKILSGRKSDVAVRIDVRFDRNRIEITDNASGIDFESARDEIFRFGRASDGEADSRDRLSVYGIGMKRAFFKIGNSISMRSDHRKGGFSLELDVQKWSKDETVPWTFEISRRAPAAHETGTRIIIRELREEIRARIADSRFRSDLIEKLSKVYSYFIDRIVEIYVNGTRVEGTIFAIGSNFSHHRMKRDGVECSITAGIAAASGDRFLAETAGWFVFCNFRTVLYADKSPLTGWGRTLPLFQPKHRPFLGLVLFTSSDPEQLPWTTTKGSINEDNLMWQEAKARMVAVAKPVLRFLDTRYSDEGTDVEPGRVVELSGQTSNVFHAAISSPKQFVAKVKEAPTDVKIQYWAKITEVDRIRKHFGRSKMSASEVGRKTFEFFLRNEVEDE